MKAILQSKAFAAVSHFYGNNARKRSGILYIKHIDEGLEILTSIGAAQVVKDAWCLHPLLQDDKDLIRTLTFWLPARSGSCCHCSGNGISPVGKCSPIPP